VKREGWELLVWIDGKKSQMTCLSKKSALLLLHGYMHLADKAKGWKSFSSSIRKRTRRNPNASLSQRSKD